jgi:hypothetical protein
MLAPDHHYQGDNKALMLQLVLPEAAPMPGLCTMCHQRQRERWMQLRRPQPAKLIQEQIKRPQVVEPWTRLPA